jgi:L-iditol 2-dehydrogenase
MHALLLTAPKRLEIAEIPAPTPGPHDLLVRVRACGICGSDVHGYDGSTGRRIPPLVMGHEAAGVVEAVGEAVTAFRPGDRVTFDSTVSCGECAHCRRGEINLCDGRNVLGVSCAEYRRHGCFAEYVVVPDRIAYALPDNLSFAHAAMIEAVSVAVHAVHRTPLRLGDTVVVVGAGMIGLLVVQVLRRAGVGRVIAVDLDPGRLALARQFGAEESVVAGSGDAAAEVLRLTGGRGADAAFEVVGATPTVKLAVASLRKGGSLTLVGNLAPSVELPLQAVVTRELSLFGTCASRGEYPVCIDWMARGWIDVAPLISAVAPLSEGPSWFDRLHAAEPGLMKVILTP